MEKPSLPMPRFDDTPAGVTAASLPARGGCAWFDQAVRQLQAIERLPDGWDSHGAGRPDLKTIQSALNVLAAMALHEETLTKPQINPTPSGGVQFDWESGPRYFEIEFVDPLTAEYYLVDREARTETEGELHVGDSLNEIIGYARGFGLHP